MAVAAGAVYRSEEKDDHEWWFRGRDLVKYIRDFKGMKGIKEAEIYSELKNIGATTAVKYIDKSMGNSSLWVLSTEENKALNVSADDFKLNNPIKDWEDE